jgi:hypothetical protein
MFLFAAAVRKPNGFPNEQPPTLCYCAFCPVGHSCNPDVTPLPVACSAGRFQELTGQSTCNSCPIGECQGDESALFGTSAAGMLLASDLLKDNSVSCFVAFACSLVEGTYSAQIGSASAGACQQWSIQIHS